MNNFFRVGDKVRILDGSKNKSYCGGWADGMYKYVGKTSIVIGSSERGVYLGDNVFTWDARYLELIERGKMENKITIDGKEYKLSAELVEKIKAEVVAQEKAENPFERKTNERYYYVDSTGGVYSFVDNEGATAKTLYNAGNYCRDKGLMEQRALHETLNRLLWQYSETHGGDNAWNFWNLQEHYYIYFDTQNCVLYVHYNDAHRVEGVVYFKDKATAEAAIEEVVKPFMAAHPEFEW